jgi:AcrR family transcriptional regulator
MPRKDPRLERRNELILAAVSTIAEHGFDRLTMARVAKTAKASPAAGATRCTGRRRRSKS